MISVFTSVFRPQNVSGDTQNALHSMSVTVHPSKEVSDVSIFSTTSVFGAMNSVRAEISSSLTSVEADIQKEFG